MFLWEVKWLSGFGAMTIIEEIEVYKAFTKYGVWKQFCKKHIIPPAKYYDSGYTDPTHFATLRAFSKLVTFKGI